MKEAFRDQVHCADVVVGAKADIATEADGEAFRAWAADELYPAKSLVTTIAHGALSLDVLDMPCGPTAPALHTHHREQAKAEAVGAGTTAGASGASGVGDAGAAGSGSGGGGGFLTGAGPLGVAPIPTAVTPGKPYRVLGGTAEFKTAGWVFSREEVFARPRLTALFQSLASEPRVKRVKGVVRVGAEWVMPQVVNDPDGGGAGGGGGMVKLEPIAYRRDSRLEIIVMTTSSSSSDGEGGGGGGGDGGEGEGSEENEGVECAARAAAACDWDALEAAIKAAIQPPRAVKS